MRAAAHAHSYPTVSQYMTPTPHTINRSSTLARAQQAMREHEIRHLPVLEGGRVVGLLSERDLFLVESLPGVNPTVVRVEDAMVQSPYLVLPETPVADVAQAMIDRKIGSALVSQGDRVVGVFTTVDALRALVDQLAATP